AVSLSLISGSVLMFAFDILTHATYNYIVSSDKRLELPLESEIASLQQQLIDLGIENIPDIAIRAVSQQYYNKDDDNVYGRNPNSLGFNNGITYMVGISGKQFMQGVPNDEASKKIYENMDSLYPQASLTDKFMILLRNTVSYLFIKHGFEKYDYDNEDILIEQTPVLVAFEGEDSNNINELNLGLSIAMGAVKIRKTVAKSLFLSAKETNAFSFWYSHIGGKNNAREIFSVRLTQDELNNLISSFAGEKKADIGKYVSVSLYKKFLERLVALTKENIALKAAEGKIAVNAEKLLDTKNRFFNEDGSEKFSEPVILSKAFSLEQPLREFTRELSEIMEEAGDAKNIIEPQFRHFSIAADRKPFEERNLPSSVYTLDNPVSQDEISEAGASIPFELYGALSKIKGNLGGTFQVGENGVIFYLIDNPNILNAVNAARDLFPKDSFWKSGQRVSLTLFRPTKPYSAKTLSKISALLEKYNNQNPLANEQYSFDDIVYGQFTSTGRISLQTPKVKNLRDTVRMSEMLSRFKGQNASRIVTGLRDSQGEAHSYNDILLAIDELADAGFDRYEISADLFVGDTPEEKKENAGKKNIFEILKNFADDRQKLAQIKEKARQRGIKLTLHLASFGVEVADKRGGKISVFPHPGFEDRDGKIKSLYDNQLKIAQLIGADTITIHLDDKSAQGASAYAQFVIRAARLAIYVNFENSLVSTPFEVYAPSFIKSEDFISSLQAIKEEIEKENDAASDYFGVTIDTSKALNSLTGQLTESASEEEFEENVRAISMENLINYYKAVKDAGFTINNIHLSQFSPSAEAVRKIKGADGQYKIIFYNKSDIDDNNNPNFDIYAFLEFLEEEQYAGAINQETRGRVSPRSVFVPDVLTPAVYNDGNVFDKFKDLLRSLKLYFKTTVKPFAAAFNNIITAPFLEETFYRWMPLVAAALTDINPIFFLAVSAIFFIKGHLREGFVPYRDPVRETQTSPISDIKDLADLTVSTILFSLLALIPLHVLGGFPIFSLIAHSLTNFLVLSGIYDIYRKPVIKFSAFSNPFVSQRNKIRKNLSGFNNASSLLKQDRYEETFSEAKNTAEVLQTVKELSAEDFNVYEISLDGLINASVSASLGKLT
ncbi:MAG: hypothetical protein LBQ47_03865, partial [Endomicrobium sp.]|nr:hypothetical protein [Endomicrobium sp.]